MLSRLWRALMARFVSKEKRFSRLDRLADTDQARFEKAMEKMSVAERDEYLDWLTDQCEQRLDSEIRPCPAVQQVVVAQVDEVKGQDPGYHWAPGQEHNEPKPEPTSRRHRPGVFERQPPNRKQRRQQAAVERRKSKNTVRKG